MIVSIAHKGLRLLWEEDDGLLLPAEQLGKLRIALDLLDAMCNLQVFRSMPKYRLHKLAGNYEGFWSISITGNDRIIFRFEEGDVYLLNYLDYH